MTAADCWADLEAKAKAATPGEWTTQKPENNDAGFLMGLAVAQTPFRQVIYATPPGGSFPSADAAFIAAANPATILKLIEAARHSQPGAEGGVVGESGWLIEIPSSPRPLWFALPGHWLIDSAAALRFARKQDAEAFLDYESPHEKAFVSEHIWSGPSPQQPATSTDEKVGDNA